MQYNWKYRIYKGNNRTSPNFSDCVGDNIRVKITKDMFYPHTSVHTPFMNVKLQPFNAPKDLTQFVSTLKPKNTKLIDVFNTVKNIIFKNWMPDKIHLIGSSSGYDSRIIAKAIQQLVIKHGRDWLGETYFIECAGEAEALKAIMKRLKFSNYITWIPDYTLEFFENIHERFNGLCAYPFNIWYDYYVRNWKEDDIQYISGYGGNVADVMHNYPKYGHPVKKRMDLSQRLLWYFKMQYYYQISAFREPRYSLHPFWNYDYIRVASGFQPRCERTAHFLSDYLVPECKNIPRMKILREVTRNGHRTVKPKELRRMEEWYRSTAYGKVNPISPKARIEYNLWWLQYCIASFLESKKVKKK